MSNTHALMNEDNAGLQPMMPAMKPWEIAELPLFRFLDGQAVDVEHASDQQFDAWRTQNGIPAKPGAWSFERRCKAINQCRFYGHWDALKFPVDFSADVKPGAPNSAESAQKSAEEGENSPKKTGQSGDEKEA